MPKNTTQCPRLGLELRLFDPEASVLTMKPPVITLTYYIPFSSFLEFIKPATSRNANGDRLEGVKGLAKTRLESALQEALTEQHPSIAKHFDQTFEDYIIYAYNMPLPHSPHTHPLGVVFVTR